MAMIELMGFGGTFGECRWISCDVIGFEPFLKELAVWAVALCNCSCRESQALLWFFSN